MNVKAACDTSMPLKGRSRTKGQRVLQQVLPRTALTSKVRVLSNRLLITVSAEVAKNFQVVVRILSSSLTEVQILELREDELGVATVLVQVGSAGRRIGLVVL